MPSTNASSDDKLLPKPLLNPYLDLVRGLAMFLVLGRHLSMEQPSLSGSTALLGYIHRVGWVGVDLFFVLSGFLVSGILFRELRSSGKIKLRIFFIRRAFKIYPTFLALILISLLSRLQSQEFADLLPDIFLVENYIVGRWAHLWTLSSEEQFYLLLGFIVWKIQSSSKMNSLSRLPIICCSIIIIAPILRILTPQLDEFSYWHSVFPLHLRMDTFAVGVLSSYLFYFHTEKVDVVLKKYKHLLFTLVILIFALPFFSTMEESRFMTTIGFSFLATACGIVIMLLARKKHAPKLHWRYQWLVMLGKYSYPVYIWHFPIKVSLIPRIEAMFALTQDGFWSSLIYLSLSVFGGIFFAHCVEIPLLMMRDRFFPSEHKPESVVKVAA